MRDLRIVVMHYFRVADRTILLETLTAAIIYRFLMPQFAPGSACWQWCSDGFYGRHRRLCVLPFASPSHCGPSRLLQ